MNPDVWDDITQAMLDLQAAGLQNYDRPLKRLGQALARTELAQVNDELTADLDLQAFLDESEKTGGSMVGSHRLAWPDDRRQELGLTWLIVQKLSSDPRRAINFAHTYFDAGRKLIDNLHSLYRQLFVPFVRDYKIYVVNRGAPSRGAMPLSKSKKIFIVHGHDTAARETVARQVMRLDLDPVILHEQANRGRTVIEKVEDHSDVGFAIVLLTPDDEGRAKGAAELEPRARQNVLLELGYFLGKLGRSNVCALKRGTVEIPSDFAGVVWTAMDDSGAWKTALGQELQAAGYRIDWNRVMGAGA